MKKPILHSSTANYLQILLSDLPQSLLITGKPGVGLSTIASYIASSLNVTPLVVLPEREEKIDILKGTITIDIIRRLYEQTRSKKTDKQIIVIDYAERMGVQAQNAFLKLLEEPGAMTYFIIVTNQPGKLLPTVRSRTQSLDVEPITSQQSKDLLKHLNVEDEQKQSRILFIAEGLPAEIHRLASDIDYLNERSQIVRDARTLLQGSLYDRLKIAQDYKDKRAESLLLLQDAAHILRNSMSLQPQSSIIQQINKLLQAHDKIEVNGNIRLCIARLVL
jgi:DNA polymerase III delta prime subunit